MRALGYERDQAHLTTAQRAPQRKNFVDVGDQFQPCEVQCVDLGAALVRARLAVLLGAAVDQGGAFFAKAGHGKGWAGAVAQSLRQREHPLADVGLGGVVVALAIELACVDSKPQSPPTTPELIATHAYLTGAGGIKGLGIAHAVAAA